MSYGIMNTYLPQDTNAALLRNLCEPGIEALEEIFPNQPSQYYFDICVQYDGGGLLSLTRVYVENRNDEGVSVLIESQGSPPAGAIGDTVWFPPNSPNTGHPTIPMKSITMSQRIDDGQVVWGLNSYQVDSWSTSAYSGLYNRDNANADVTIFYATVPVTFNYGEIWVFQTWRDTPLLQNSPSQAFLDSLHKESNYYLTYYLVDNNGSAQGAQRLYFKTDPGTIYFRTSYVQGQGSNGWFVQWDNATDSTGAWSYTLDNSGADPDDWTLDSDSGDWALPVAQYTENNPRLGYNCQEPYWLFIIESTVPIRYAGHNIDPPSPPTPEDIEYYLYKDGFDIFFGVRPTETSQHITPGDNTFNNYYLTKKYRPKIRFTSPKTGTSYEVDANNLARYVRYEATLGLSPWDGGDQIFKCSSKSVGMPQNDPSSYLQGLRCPEGDATEIDLENITYAQMVQHAAETKTSLGDLVRYFRATNPTFTSDDVYTEIFMDFYYQDHAVYEYEGTKSVDFSSLYGSGIDATTNEGKGQEGTSWNPMPNKDNDGNNPENNPNDTDTISLSRPEVSPFGHFHRTYILTAPQVEELSDLLNTTDSSTFERIITGLGMFGANPMNAIIDLRMYPFDVKNTTGSHSSPLKLCLGAYESDILAIPMSKNPLCSYYMGGYNIQEVYGNFLDYEPFTIIRLYIPYIGTIELQPSLYMNHMVSVNMIVDFYTGAATAVIYRDGIPMTYHEGVIGTSICITGDDAASYANTIVGNIVGAIGSAAGAISAGITPTSGGAGGSSKASNIANGVTGAIGGIFDTINSINDTKFQQAGSTSPSMGNWMPQKCHILIARPQLAFDSPSDLGTFSNDVGFATNYSSLVSSLVDSGIYYGILRKHTGTDANEPSPTDKEVELIKAAINNGFYKS